MALFCLVCGRQRHKPLFFIIENDVPYPICHFCVEERFGNATAVARGGWEIQLSGNTWLVKVRR